MDHIKCDETEQNNYDNKPQNVHLIRTDQKDPHIKKENIHVFKKEKPDILDEELKEWQNLGLTSGFLKIIKRGTYE